MPHQQRWYDTNPKKAIAYHEMRTGKSLIGAEWIARRTGLRVIVCPKQVKKDWEAFNTGAIVLSKEEFKKVANTFNPNAIVVDECFVGGTMILLASGKHKPIEEICIGDNVINATGVGVVSATIKNQVNEIAVIKTGDKNTIETTPNHPFFTGRGWVKARELTQSDVLLHYYTSHYIMKSNDLHKKSPKGSFLHELQKFIQTNTLGQQFLFKQVFKEFSQHTQGGNFAQSKIREMLVWKRCGNSPRWRDIKNVLLQPLNKKSTQRTSRELVRSTQNEFKENEREKPHVQCFVEGEIKADTSEYWSQTQSSWWKWSGDACTSKSFAGSTWRRLVCGTFRINIIAREISRKISYMLQNRRCTPKAQNCNRSGWEFPQFNRKKKARQEENHFFGGVGVESVTIQKRKNTPVFNLSVSGHPSYVVNNIVVHNCHYFGSALFLRRGKGRSQLAAALYSLVQRNPHMDVLLLTATPVRNDAWSLHTLLCYIGEYYDWKAWREEFFELKAMPFLPRQPWMRSGQVPEAWAPRKGWREKLVPYLQKHTDMVSLVDIVEYLPPAESVVVKIKRKDRYVAPEDEIVTWTHEHQWEQKGKGAEILALGYKKVIVVCHYTAQIDALAVELGAEGRSVYVLDGRTKDADVVKRGAQEAESCYFIVQASMGFGFDGYMFGATVFASMSHSCVHHTQMLGRARHVSHLQPVVYCYLIGGRWDKRIYDTVMEGRDFNPQSYE